MKAICLVGVLALCVSCSGQHNAHNDARAVLDLANWVEVINNDSGKREPVESVTYPTDLNFHPYARLESVLFRAVVTNSAGDVLSHEAQIDRFQIRSLPKLESEWDFSSVVRGRVTTVQPGETVATEHEAVERVALGLAVSQRDKLAIGQTHIEVSQATGENVACGTHIDINSTITESISLEGNWGVCPKALSLGSFNRWEVNAIPVAGQIAGSVVKGHAWFTHSWGHTLPTAGAVLLDTIELSLESSGGSSLLSVTRSKRRSGRGPLSIQAHWIQDRVPKSTALSLEWIDDGTQTSKRTGVTYPKRFRLQTPDASINLILTPLVSLPEIVDTIGTRWSGAVTVEGSHKGVGFVDVYPVGSTIPESNS